MTKVITSIAALLFSVALLQTGNGLQGILVPVRAEMESFSTFSIGLLGSTYFVGFIAGCLCGPYFIRQVGHIRVFTAMAAIASAVPLAHAMLLMPMPWWILRIFTGFCFAVLSVIIESWLNERATKHNRGLIMGIYLVINMTVITVGQMMMTLFEVTGFLLFAMVSVLISLASVPVALSAAQAPAPIKSIQINLRRVFRISPVGSMGCLAVGAANGAFWALAPTFASASDIPVSGIAIFMSTTVLAGAVGQLPIGKLSDRMDRRKVMIAVSLLAVIAGAVLFWQGGSSGNTLYIITAIWGFLVFPMYGLAVAHANDYAKPDQFVELTGGLLLLYAIGAIVGPMVAAALMTQLQPSYLYAFTAAIHFILAGYIFWRMQRRAAVDIAEHGRFIDALEASVTVSNTFDSETQENLVRQAEESGRTVSPGDSDTVPDTVTEGSDPDTPSPEQPEKPSR